MKTNKPRMTDIWILNLYVTNALKINYSGFFFLNSGYFKVKYFQRGREQVQVKNNQEISSLNTQGAT